VILIYLSIIIFVFASTILLGNAGASIAGDGGEALGAVVGLCLSVAIVVFIENSKRAQKAMEYIINIVIFLLIGWGAISGLSYIMSNWQWQ